MLPSLLALMLIPGLHDVLGRQARWVETPLLAAKIDALVEKDWQANKVHPAALADDVSFLRRVTLDLAGRIPTAREAQDFLADRSPVKRAAIIRRLMTGPEYPLHLGRVLDEMIQGKFAGDAGFVEYLRSAVARHAAWDQIFRDVLLGPWDDKSRTGADRFLARRLASLDDLTNDTARVFFGVNVSCAKCHDHPQVADWTQDQYYGMASFFNPTYEGSKTKGKGKGRTTSVMEKAGSEVMFVTTKGERRTGKLMFLSNRVVTEAAGSVSRREQLVKIALEEKAFFSKAIVNRMWDYLFGQGLVQPVDQMHSANPPVLPAVLEFLADDLARHGYDLDRLVAGLVSSRVYQLAGTKAGQGEEPSERYFARARLRPLTPRQLALSLVLATGEETGARTYRDLENRAAGLVKLELLDARSDRFQSSTVEALFMSNQAGLQRLVEPSGKNLAARLVSERDTGGMVDLAVWTILSRPPAADEKSYLVGWLEGHKQDRARGCSELLWALLASAEFRFNH